MSITLTDGREVVIYPFPLSSGQVATIELPANETFSWEEAARMAAFVMALCVTGEAPEPLPPRS